MNGNERNGINELGSITLLLTLKTAALCGDLDLTSCCQWTAHVLHRVKT